MSYAILYIYSEEVDSYFPEILENENDSNAIVKVR